MVPLDVKKLALALPFLLLFLYKFDVGVKISTAPNNCRQG